MYYMKQGKKKRHILSDTWHTMVIVSPTNFLTIRYISPHIHKQRYVPSVPQVSGLSGHHGLVLSLQIAFHLPVREYSFLKCPWTRNYKDQKNGTTCGIVVCWGEPWITVQVSWPWVWVCLGTGAEQFLPGHSFLTYKIMFWAQQRQAPNLVKVRVLYCHAKLVVHVQVCISLCPWL